MSTADIVVLVAEVAVIAGLGWYFFGPRRARIAQLDDGVQSVEVTVRGGSHRLGWRRLSARLGIEHRPPPAAT